MRTDDEILAKIKNGPPDFFNFSAQFLLDFLSIEGLEELSGSKDDGRVAVASQDRDVVLAQMRDYMPFALEKVADERGISALRSMHHYTVWIWIIGDEDEFPNLLEFSDYGAENLRLICEKYGWNMEEYANPVQVKLLEIIQREMTAVDEMIVLAASVL